MKRTVLLLCLLGLAAGTLRAADEYPLGPDSQRQPGVPQGAITHDTWTSRIFPGSVRDYWVYVPAQYTPDKPACVMVFQDGEMFMKEDGRARVPIVFDNLIAKHEMPVTIAVFINPGVLKAASPDQQARFNRSFEYDALGDRYARFLLEEMLPAVARRYNLSARPDDRAIAGLSSGGICAFTVAWNRPDAFHRVLSFIGSFADLRGGDIYPALIRKTEPKPLRVFLQDGDHDLNLFAGDWWLANQSMESALQYAGYEVKFVTGDKNHDMEQGGAILPDALRWLWRDYPQPVAKPAPDQSGDQRVAILDPAHEWELVFGGAGGSVGSAQPAPSAASLAVDARGDVFFSEADRIMEADAAGKVSTFQQNAGAPRGLAFGADGQLYACDGKPHSIASYGPNREKRVWAAGVDCQDLAVTKDGGIYFTAPSASHDSRVRYVSSDGTRRDLPPEAGTMPEGIRLSPDQALLYLSDPARRWITSAQVLEHGAVTNTEPFYRLETIEESASGAAGMTVDSLGYLYVTTHLGIQVCDQPGRVVAILNPPGPDPMSGIAFGGPDLQDLYVAAGGKLFKRHLLRKGVQPWAVQKPPVPRL